MMESWEKLFASGKYVECSRALEVLLKVEGTSKEESLGVKLFYYIHHNKIVSDALTYNWFDEETDSSELHQVWCSTFTKLTNLCDTLKCELLTSNSGCEVFSVATLNLLSWSWENLGDHFDGFIDQINKLTMFSLQTELSSCGESPLEAENILDLAELYKKCIWRIQPHQCHVLLDTICLSFLHILRLETCEQTLTRCLKILEGLFDILPQVYIHLTRAPARKSPSLFLLGPNIASLANDPDLSVNFLVIVTILYLLRFKHYDKAWYCLEKNSCAKNTKVEMIIEYIRAIVCLRRNELDRSLYHINCLSSMPMEPNMIKRKNIFSGWIHILMGNNAKALECLRDSTGLLENEDQLPIHVYLMAHAYGALGQHEQQLVLLDCVVEVLREDPRYMTNRITPISSLQDRLLRSLHQQPELSLVQTLLAVAEVHLKTSQPETASEHLLEALRHKKCCPALREKPCDFVKVRSFESVIRDAVVSLIKCRNFSNARILCNGLMDTHVLESETFLNQAITRILLSDVQSGVAEEKQAVLLEAVKLLKKQKETIPEEGHEAQFYIIDSLMARALYRKAKLYSSIGYNNDASAYFNRALALKEDDVVLREYQQHLYTIGKTDDARGLLKKVQAQPTSFQRVEELCSEGYITMNYLINETVQEES